MLSLYGVLFTFCINVDSDHEESYFSQVADLHKMSVNNILLHVYLIMAGRTVSKSG